MVRRREYEASRRFTIGTHLKIPGMAASGVAAWEKLEMPEVIFTCQRCGIEGSLSCPENVAELSAGEGITTNQPCPQCGGEMRAPAGTYKNVNGIMTRDGDYDHPSR